MKAEIRSIEQIGPGAWRRFIGDHPLSGVYHHEGWHGVIEKTYGYKADYCVIYGEDGIEAALPFVRVSGPLRRRLVSYPYSDACDPLVKDSAQLGAIMQKVEELRAGQRIASAEQRTYHLMDYLPETPFSGEATYCNYVLDLSPGSGRLFKLFHKDCVQRAIKKAQKSSVEVTEGRTIADLKEFYRLHTDTRKRLGSPVQPFRFFANLWEILYPPGVVSLLLAREGGTNIAGVVQLKFKDTVYYKFAASDRRRLASKPNHLIIWKMIEDAQREGYRYLDFGRTFTGDSGLMQWKARWGAGRHDFRYVYPADSGGSRFNREGNRANAVLSGILKRMPAFIVRASGELFYRYLA
jgi:CelD/BcsL family acetyltransferase involved in cellulose biosynthesis